MMRPAAGTVLVTGGTIRLGRAIAEKLRASGWRVLTSSHRPDSGADIVADLADPAAGVKLYLEAIRMAPDLSAIVNNAALFSGSRQAMRAVNYDAPVKLTTLLAGKEDVKPAVVNILDTDVLYPQPPKGGSPEKQAYLETKRDLLAYTLKSACLFAEALRVNAVAPGAVLAPVSVREAAGQMLMPVRPSVDDVATAVDYLLKPGAVTGVVIPVDAGRHLLLKEGLC